MAEAIPSFDEPVPPTAGEDVFFINIPHPHPRSALVSTISKRLGRAKTQEEGDAPTHLCVIVSFYSGKKYRHRVVGTREEGLALFPHHAPPVRPQSQHFYSIWIQPLFLLYMSPTADCEVLGLWP